MKDFNFLDKLKTEGKLELVEPSEEMSLSYEKKARDCLQASKLVFNGGLNENAVGEAYYSIYNSVQSLFFRCGIKCENHSASAILLKKVFNFDTIYKTFSDAKEERIDKQYYVTSKQIKVATKESAQTLITTAGNFILQIEDYKRNLTLNQIEEIRKRFNKI